MTFQQFLLIFRARWPVILLTFLGLVGTTVAVSLLLPKKYTASAAILVDVKAPDPIFGALMPGMMAPGYMATQIDIIQSERVARRVVRMLKIDENPSARQQWQEDTEGKGSIEAYYAELLGKQLDVKPSRESNVINISYKSAEPQFASTIANAFAQACIDTNVELRADPAKQYAGWFDARTKGLREQLQGAQSKLSRFQRDNGIVNADERLDVESARLQEISSQLVAMQALRAESNSRQAQSGNTDTLPEVLQSGLVQSLKADVARQEAKFKDLSSQYGPNHPQVLRAVAEGKALRIKLDAEVKRVAGGVGTNARVNVQRESEIRAALDAQKKKVLALKQQRDEIAVLQREVENAQKAYDLTAQRLVQTSLESQTQQTNVVLLNPAVEPVEESFPKFWLNVAVSMFLGLAFGVGLALLLETLNRRVRAAEDIVEALGVPVIGYLNAAGIKAGRARRSQRLLFPRFNPDRALPSPR
ncbi:MAG: chain length determinant protein EpsF [Sterolibacteriaceae bacterium]|uniref:Chain length determinant protein EpsF n=1 Tax=Candidatus Methylophosphatis roskildensis TaxID=2899263 RepID=A0A9D7E6F2_9PROT|nr:chain length determinant protein EpsF [Candidatus Methylophosphatis roskildensis]MBK7237455.1 chain length determinant protein EpsF [Sterolibacteriaceae bacterium]